MKLSIELICNIFKESKSALFSSFMSFFSVGLTLKMNAPPGPKEDPFWNDILSGEANWKQRNVFHFDKMANKHASIPL